MVVPTSQGDVVINMPVLLANLSDVKIVRNVGVRLSGGADSAILAYMLAIYKRDYKTDITLYSITCVNDQKPYQEIFAKKVMEKIAELTGVEFGEHFVKDINGDDYVENQRKFVEELYSQKKLDIHFMGETMNPPLEVEHEENWIFQGGGRDISRDGLGKLRKSRVSYTPLRNINKKGIKELYDYFGVLESLFPITRSCEMQIDNRRFKSFEVHCDICWFCLERKWGFGRYV